MSNGATITGDVELGTGSVYRASRIRWTGGNVNGRFLGRQFQDVLFDDFNLNSGSNYNDLTANANRFDRIAFLNTTFQNSPPSGSGTSWVLYNQQIYSGPLHTGFFWLNSKAISTALHAWRVMSIDGILICDSAFNPTGTATSTGMRIHLRSTNVWVKDSWIRGIVHTAGVDTASGDSVPQITNGLFDNFDRYVTTDNSWYSVTNAPFTEAEIRNSRMYSTAGAGAYVYPTGGFTNGGGNDKVAWDGSTLPDYSIIGAVR
jgi:hypothetical protein